MMGPELALAAEGLMGVPFRLHGRDPATGIDCIGLLACTFAACGIKTVLPTGYSLRTGQWQGLELFADQLGFGESCAPFQPGDICLFQPSPAQLHFAISSLSTPGFVEAHAGLRRVVISPAPSRYPLLRLWRDRA
ncbi:MAG: hypothetical protein ABIW31_01490 [Novosphingobium sp.]